jgi:hypothetical protein
MTKHEKPSHLFSDYDLSKVLEGSEAEMLHEIDALDPNRILDVSIDELSDYFQTKYCATPISLDVEKTTVAQEEVDVGIRRQPNRVIGHRIRPHSTKGVRVSFFVPFDGNEMLFRCRSSRYTLDPPKAIVRKDVLIFTYSPSTDDGAVVRQEFDREFGLLREWVGWINQQVTPYNGSIGEKAKQRIERRRQKLIKDRGLVSGLGFPVRKRADAPDTYIVPTRRKKIPFPKPTTTASSTVEPMLEAAVYDDILSIISNMVAVMERSPKTFEAMGEEALRQHFLVQLNGQFEGQATGETFNFEGKTDILIRHEGKNIFIAECKFWTGPESLRKTLDQLLRYLSWRDTKTAIILFNRNRSFSTVLSKIPEVMKAHPSFLREEDYASESGFRFIVHHSDDKDREMTVTILAFEVPS